MRIIIYSIALFVVAVSSAHALKGGKRIFDEQSKYGAVQVFSKMRGTFMYMVEDGMLRAWSDDGASRRAHLSLALSPRVNKALVIGPGAGAAVEAAYFHGAESVNVVMKNPSAVRAAGKVSEAFGKAMQNPKTKIAYASATEWLDRAGGKYDVIFLWPGVFKPEETAPAINVETFEKTRSLLSPGGTVTLWIPLGMSGLKDIKSTLATFTSVFPEVTIWVPELNPSLGWAVVIGSTSPISIDLGKMSTTLTKVSGSYRIIEADNLASLLSFYITNKAGIKEALSKSAVIRRGEKSNLSTDSVDWKKSENYSREGYKFFMEQRTLITSLTNASAEEAKKLDNYFNARSLMMKARLTRKTSEGSTELGLYDEAIKVAPDEPNLAVLCQTLGKSYLIANMPRKAASILERAKKISPNHAPTRFYLGRAYEQMRRYELASPEYAKLKELEPNFMQTISESGIDFGAQPALKPKARIR